MAITNGVTNTATRTALLYATISACNEAIMERIEIIVTATTMANISLSGRDIRRFTGTNRFALATAMDPDSTGIGSVV